MYHLPELTPEEFDLLKQALDLLIRMDQTDEAIELQRKIVEDYKFNYE